MNIRVVKQDPISIHTKGDLNTEHLFIYSLTTTPSGKILVVDVHRGYTYVNMLDIEGNHLSHLIIPPGPHHITTVSEEEALLLQWADNIILILDISTMEMSVKQKIELDASFNARYITAFQDKIILSCWCYPGTVKMIDRTGKIVWSSIIEDIQVNNRSFKNASCIIAFSEENKPKVIAADIPFLRNGLVKLDAETGKVIKFKRLESIHPLGLDVDVERGNLFVMTSSPDYMVVGSTLDLEHQRVLLTTDTGLNSNSYKLWFNRTNQQLLVASKDVIDRFQVVV